MPDTLHYAGAVRDRRAHPRLNKFLILELHKGDKTHRLFTVDISAGGFRAVGELSFEVGGYHKVDIHINLGPSVHGTARVVWTRPMQPQNLYETGFALEEVADPVAFQRLLRFIEKERKALKEPVLSAADHYKLRQLTAQELTRMEVLCTISKDLNSSLELPELLEKSVRVAVEATGAERGLLLLDRGGQLEIPVACALEGTTHPKLSYSEKVARTVLSNGEPLLSLDATQDDRLADSSSIKVLKTRSVLCVPIRARGKIFGLLYLDSSIKAGAFTVLDLQLTTLLSDLTATAIEQAQSFNQALHNHKLTLMGTLLAGITHELNNPLTSILNIAELLENDNHELAKTLRQEALRCKEMVGRVLRVSRKEEHTVQPTDLSAVVSDTLPLLQKEFLRNNAHLKPDLVPRTMIMGKADRLRQVVLNLVSNALHAIKDSSTPTVWIRVYPQEDQAYLVISDNGTGINSNDLPRIFDPFFTTKPPQQGTGLGLTITRKIVTEHRGHIEITQRASGGTLVTVEFPLLKINPERNKP